MNSRPTPCWQAVGIGSNPISRTMLRLTLEEEIAQQVIACWIEDCGGDPPPLTREQLALLLDHVEVGVMRGGE